MIPENQNGFNTNNKSIVARVLNAGNEYKSGDTKIIALKPCMAELIAGELLLIIGPSGSGKTTLLSLFGCVLYPKFGEVWNENILITSLIERRLANLRLIKIGFVFQRFNLIATLTALENIMIPLILQAISNTDAKEKATTALTKVSMENRIKNLSYNISGRQKSKNN